MYAKSVYQIQEERLKLFKSLVQITTDRPKHSSYEIDNLKADIQYATQKIVELSTKRYIEAKNNYSDLIINANAHQEVLTQHLDIMSRHFYSYLELMQDIGHDILIEEEVL